MLRRDDLAMSRRRSPLDKEEIDSVVRGHTGSRDRTFHLIVAPILSQ